LSASAKPFRLWPQSLWGQVFAGTVTVIALGQILSTLLFALLVLRPELIRVSKIMAENVAAVTTFVENVEPDERARLIKLLGQSSYIEVWPGSEPPDGLGPRPRLLERVFMRQLVVAMGGKSDLYWRTDRDRKLWLRLHAGNEAYWVSVKSIPTLGPTGLVLASGLVSLGLALCLAYGVNLRLMRPLEVLKGATENFRLSAGAVKLSEDGPREIASLSRSFNLMTERLMQTEADRTMILAGISHDLRTPLAKLRLQLDLMPNTDEALKASAHRQVENIDRILSQFMLYARGFDAEPIRGFDPDALILDLIKDYGDQGVVEINGPSVPAFTGRIEAVRRALGNLIENALNYGSKPVEIAVTAANHGLIFVVRDRGPGVSPDRLSRIIEPFVRGDEARGAERQGTGLGLAMVEKIARLHEGRLELENIEGGFEARLILHDHQMA
jgi:two-component system, OmpR family, osmolarity sensor histidine kinase EnvZ